MKIYAILLLCTGSVLAEKTCHEPAESGVCMAYFPRFYYDPKTQTCKKFIYGGCGGNGNRYETEEECLENCAGQRSGISVCLFKPMTGPCKAYLPSYYYDFEDGECKSFIYGGCGGNGNRFESKDDCKNTCSGVKLEADVGVCALEHETGPCRAYIPSYYFDASAGVCKPFIYGGCGGNGNRFGSEEECYDSCGQRSDVNLCALEPEKGPCRAYIPSYFYNSKTGKCEKFIYGGCGGNGNRFRTEEKCHATCAQKSEVEDEDVCSLKPEVGMCRGAFPFYYFDSETNECKEFIYGGCGGNGNRFATAEACYKKCSAIWKADEGCSEDADTGPCRGKFPRYFFNKVTGKCEEFIYGGCRGNKNNYKSYEECSNSCGAP